MASIKDVQHKGSPFGELYFFAFRQNGAEMGFESHELRSLTRFCGGFVSLIIICAVFRGKNLQITLYRLKKQLKCAMLFVSRKRNFSQERYGLTFNF
jgi:hypothetical protein